MLDSGGTNLGSVQYAFERLGVRAELSRDPEHIRRASHVVLPGVGAAAPGMQRLRASGLDRLIPTLTQPVLGVCLGMQLLFEASEEGDTACLGILKGRLTRFDEARCGRVPHMGWNDVTPTVPHPLIVPGEAYFLHSYHFCAENSADVAAMSAHGQPIVAAVQRDNILGVQFHPESVLTPDGEQIIRNWLGL